MKPIVAYRLVTVTVNQGTGDAEVPFQDVSELRSRGARVVGIETFNVDQMAFTPDGLPSITVADSMKCTVTFKDPTSLERLKDVPLWTLNPVYMGGIYKQFVPFEANWQSCFVKFTGGHAAAAQYNVPFGIMWEVPQ